MPLQRSFSCPLRENAQSSLLRQIETTLLGTGNRAHINPTVSGRLPNEMMHVLRFRAHVINDAALAKTADTNDRT